MDKEWTEKLKDIMATFEEKEPSGLWYDIMKALPDGDIANAMHTNLGEKTFEKSSDSTSRRNAHTQSRKKILFIRIASVAVAAIAILMFHIVKTTNITDNGKSICIWYVGFWKQLYRQNRGDKAYKSRLRAWHQRDTDFTSTHG